MRGLWLVFATLLLAACSPSDIVMPEEMQRSEQLIEAIRIGNDELALSFVTAEIHAGLRTHLPAMRAALPESQPVYELQTASFLNISDAYQYERRARLVYDVVGGDKTGWAEIVIVSTPTRNEVFSIYVGPGAAIDVNPFDLTRHWQTPVVIAIQALVAVTCVWACITALRTRGLRRRWLWALGSLVAVCAVWYDSQAGAFVVNPIYISLLGVSVTKHAYIGPWILQFALPIPAVIALMKCAAIRRQLRDAAQP